MVNVFFKTYGCQANVADSTSLVLHLENLGCRMVSHEIIADLIIVNSCAIREKAEQKLFSYLGELAQLKKDKPCVQVGVIGCVASYRKKEIFERFDHVNFVFGAKENINILRSYLETVVRELATIKKIYEKDLSNFFIKYKRDRDIEKVVASKNNLTGFSTLSRVERKKGEKFKRSFINIMTGCDNYCAYCIVPFTRGREISYGLDSILERVKREVEGGTKEITLIGQNVNSYSDSDTGAEFIDLLRAVAKIRGDFWVRFISSHPKDMTKDVLEVIAEYHDKLCKWIHLPLQSGSNKVLKAMNRVYTVERYLEIVSWIRNILPSAIISTDIIVGFPGETNEDYLATRDVMEIVRFNLIYSFVYSKRKYSKACNYSDSCPDEEKRLRLKKLQARAKELSVENNSKQIGEVVKVLVEKKLENGKFYGRTSGNVQVHFDGYDDVVGNFVNVEIKKADLVKLEGFWVNSEI